MFFFEFICCVLNIIYNVCDIMICIKVMLILLLLWFIVVMCFNYGYKFVRYNKLYLKVIRYVRKI